MTARGKLCRFLRIGQIRIGSLALDIILIVLRRKDLIGGVLPGCVFREFVRDTRLVIVAVLFKITDIRSFIAVFSRDKPGINPTMNHIDHTVMGAGFVVAGKPVNETAICQGQRHVPGLGLNLAYAHIAAVSRFRQIDAAVGAGVDLRSVAVRSIDQIRAGDLDSLIRRANAAILAGQIDTTTFNGDATP